MVLPATVAGAPLTLPTWTQVLLRELRQGFWRKGRGAATQGAGGEISGGHRHTLCLWRRTGRLSPGEAERMRMPIRRMSLLVPVPGCSDWANPCKLPHKVETLDGMRVCAVSGAHSSCRWGR